MASLEVILYVNDVDKSVAFYRDVLGFSVGFVMPDDLGESVFAQLTYKGTAIFLDSGSVISDAARSLLGVGLVLVLNDDEGDIDGYYAQVRERGGRITEELDDRPWGDRSFSVKDPNGYTLVFSKHVRDVAFAASAL